MIARLTASLWAILSAAGVFCLAVGLSADPPTDATNKTKESNQTAAPSDDGRKPISVAEARERAKLMHSIYSATLDAKHHHFFRRDRSVLPARAMEDVFAEVDQQWNMKTGWISVNTKAMSIHHEPKNDFEKRAAKAIAAGKGEYEWIDKGYFHRATAIPLGSGCVTCHTGFFSKAPQVKRFAGLVIIVPIHEK